MFLCKYPVKSVTQHPAQVFVAPGMHLGSLLQKPLMQTRPFQYFLLSNFPSLLKSCGANHCCASLGHNCPSLLSNNIPKPQSGDNSSSGTLMHGITPGRQGAPAFVSAEILFLSPYLQLLQAPAPLKKRALRGPCARFPFLAASLPPPHTAWAGAAPPACSPAAPARAWEGELKQRRFTLASVSSFLPL